MAVALLCSAASWGYTTTDLTSAGWTQVTTTDGLSTAAAAGNYFVLIDAGTSNYAVTHSLYLGNRMYYQATVNPCEDAGELWNLESTGTANQYNLRNVSSRRYPGGWDNYMFKTTTETNADCPKTFAVNNGKWTVTLSSSGAEVGPWNNDKAVNTNGNTEPNVAGYENVAANKAAGQPGFYIYTMSSSDFLSLSINGAAANNGKNVGYFIKNPSFETGETDGWTLAESDASERAVYDAADNKFKITNSHGYRLFNTWSWGQPITQNITSIPNGRYKLQAVVANSSDGDPAKVYLLANGEHEGITCNTDGGIGVEGYVDVIVTDNSLNIGAVGSDNDDARSYIENGLWWFKADNFRLTYYGNGAEIFAPTPTDFSSSTNVSEGTWYSFTVSNKGYYSISSSAAVTLSYTQTGTKNVEDDDFATLDVAASGTERLLLSTGTFYFKSDATSNITIASLGNGVQNYAPTPTDFSSATSATNGTWYKVTIDDTGYYAITAGGALTFSYTQDGTQDANEGTFSTLTFSGAETKHVKLDEGTLYFKTNATKDITIAFDDDIQYYAVALPDGGAMTAGQWYKVDIATAGLYMATATTLANIVYTTDGNVLKSNESSVTTNFAARLNNLSATSYYVKSSTDNNLTLTLGTYTVGSAVADISYIQKGNTVTVSYADLNTNDGSATLTKDFSGVTFGGEAISVTSTTNGFTFEVPEVTANTNYTLSIPASAIGYAEASTLNAAQNITLKTPAIFDGVYYLFNTDTETYLSRGGAWATQAILDNYGLAFNVTTDASNNTKLQYFDSERWLGDDGWCYGDCSGDRVRSYIVSQVVGGYKLLNTNNSKYLAVNNSCAVGDAVEGGNLVGTSNIWSFESTSAHRAIYTSNADAQATTAATDAGLSCTSKADLESELSSNYGETPISITGAKAEKYQVYAAREQSLSEAVYHSETVTGLTPGLYRLSVDAFQRAATKEQVAAADGARSLAYLYAGSAKTQLKSMMDAYATSAYSSDFEYDGKHYPNNEASGYTALANCDYSNDVYVYVPDAGNGTGSLEIGIKMPTRLGDGLDKGTWVVYNNWTLTFFETKATSQEKSDLASAISAAETHTLGFESGEYAPYNNVVALTALSNAKAINPETVSGAYATSVTSTLNGATWTANSGDVDAIYNSDFSAGQWSNDTWYPEGWKVVSGWSAKVDDAQSSTGHGEYKQPGSIQYGSQGIYTMPLAASQLYKLTFKYGYKDKNATPTISILNESSEGLAARSCETVYSGNDYKTAIITQTMYFTTGSAGNYVLNMATDYNIIFSDVSLVKATEEEITLSSGVPSTPTFYQTLKLGRDFTTTNWATLCVPFAFDASKFDVKELSGITVTGETDKHISMTLGDVTTPVAGKPYLVKAKETGAKITGTNVALNSSATAGRTTTDEVSGYTVTYQGTYDGVTLTSSNSNAWVVKNNLLYNVNSDVNVGAYRAYFTVDGPTLVKAMSFGFDGETGITETTEKTEGTESLFDLSGRRVSKAQKGLYIMNGKKVMVK